MQTRRRVKNAAAAAAAGDDHDSASRAGSVDQPPPGVLHVEVPEDPDLEQLAELVPDINIAAVTSENVLALYRLLVYYASDLNTTQREFEQAQADGERKDVELEQALQDRETATKELQATIEQQQAEVTQLKQERDKLASSQTALQAQLATWTATQTASTTEVQRLKQQVEDVEREKRDLIGVVSRLKEDAVQRDEEVANLRANLKQARQDYQTLEGELREARSIETTTKFKLDSLTQQLELARAEAERTSTELSAKSEEFSKFRRARNAEQAQLQAQHDSLTQSYAACDTKLKALQTSHATQSHQLSQALARVQDLTGQLAEQEAKYANEASLLRQLISRLEEREAQTKAYVDGIEKEWAVIGDKAQRREDALRDEVESEKRRADLAEERVQELERVMHRMDSGDLPIPVGGSVSMPGTPGTPLRNGTPDVLSQGLFGLSPTVAMASRVQRGGKTFTEVYADYVRLQDELAKRNAEFDHMERTLGAVLAQIEERAPLLQEQRDEYERQKSELSQVTVQLSQAISERDNLANAQQESSQKLTKAGREIELLQKQLNDLGRQVQSLMRDIARRDDPTIPADDEVEASVKPAENIEDVITNHLVLFRSLPDLQAQNQRLLKIVRELGSKMEAEEKEYKEQLEKEQGEAVLEAHQAIQELEQRLENQRKSSEATIQAYMKERETLRSMVARAERAGVAGVSTAALTNGHADVPHVNGVGASDEVLRDLAETRSQFEAFKSEMGIDTLRLREEATTAKREANELGAALAKANAKIDYMSERHRMAQESYNSQSRELDEISKRYQQLHDQATRSHIELNRTTEDLVTASGTIERLRNECANLRAEKELWAKGQSRLVEENKTLALERSQLAALMSNVQKMHADLERAGENDRRRLESQIQMMEGQIQDLRGQLGKEREELRRITLQKELELRELQGKQEKLAADLASTRESLVGAETSKKHLEERIADLNRSFQGAQEKLAVYERRPGAGSGIAHAAGHDSEQLETEVAELRAALKVAEVDLANARANAKQFEDISAANEAALASLGATLEENRIASDAELTRVKSELDAVQGRAASLQQELEQARLALAELQRTFETERTAWINDKKMLEDTIVDMSTSEKNSESDRALRESEVREQVERAKAAEERYNREVIAHAESIKTVAELRQQLTKTQEAARVGSTAAETAQAMLAASELSWKQQREALDREIEDLGARCKDLATQNSILHRDLESVTSQAARIRQAADASTSLAADDTVGTDGAETKLSELRSVVSYLRKEKEIVDLQLEIAKTENTRLTSRVEQLTADLDAEKEKLGQERQRAIEASASDAQHRELTERIHQAKLLRESNETLRADCEAHAKRARELDEQLRKVLSELEPAKEQLRVAQAELATRDAQVQRLERESSTWQERNRQLLSKYDRIDPAEVQALKDEIEQLKAEKESMLQFIQAKDEQLATQTQRTEAVEANLRQHREVSQKNTDRFKEAMARYNAQKTELNAQITDLRNQLEAVTADRDALQSQGQAGATAADIQALTKQVEGLVRDKAMLEAALSEAQRTNTATASSEPNTQLEETVAALRAERDQLLAEKETWTTAAGVTAGAESSNSNGEQQGKWDAERAELVSARDSALEQVTAATAQAQQAAKELQNSKAFNDRLKLRLQEVAKARQADQERAAEQLKAATEAGTSNAPSAEGAEQRHAEELKALETRLTEQHQKELQDVREAAASTSATGTAPTGSADPAEVAAAVAAREQELKVVHAEEVKAAMEAGRKEAAMKLRLKEGQLQKTQTRLKQIEGLLEDAKKAGFKLPDPAPTAPVPAAAAAQPSAPATTATATPVAQPPTADAPASSAGPSAVKALPAAATKPLPARPLGTGPPANAAKASAGGPITRKQSLGVPANATGAPAAALASAPPLGAGRGAKRGGAAGTAGARALNVRGAGNPSAAAAATAAATGASAPGGVSIMGAAAKRTREEPESGGNDSLAKRIKSADGAGAKPVQLRRPNPGNNPPA